jgi:hypothetical protein
MVLIEEHQARNSLSYHTALYIIVIHVSYVVNGQTSCYTPLKTNGMLTAMTNNGFRANVISTIPLVSRGIVCSVVYLSVVLCLHRTRHRNQHVHTVNRRRSLQNIY